MDLINGLARRGWRSGGDMSEGINSIDRRHSDARFCQSGSIISIEAFGLDDLVSDMNAAAALVESFSISISISCTSFSV